MTSFVGRRHELAEIKRLQSAGRLVTLTGVGGSGDDGYGEAFRFDAGLTLDDAIEYGLHDEPAAPRTPGGESELLTPREREVAELLAEGLSNREIAARLVTSQRTAETHVQNILRKLGFTTRAQIAAWVADRQLP